MGGQPTSRLSHVDAEGRARMVDVGSKQISERRASAAGQLRCAAATLELLRQGRTPKGDVLATAEIAGVMAAKRTAELIPLCHPLPLDLVRVEVAIDDGLPGLRVRAEAATIGRTGVEMEALTAVAVACLTLFDMLKAVDRTMTIEQIGVLTKSGGRSGEWSAAQ